MKNYTLNTTGPEAKTPPLTAVRKLLSLIRDDKRTLMLAFIAIFINSGLNLAGPVIVGHAIDNYIARGAYQGVVISAALLLVIYTIAWFAGVAQTKLMGGVGQRLLFNLRNAVFTKLQELPVAFFNQNKTGDLISRINSDTDKLNQFFSQSLMQLINNLFMIIGAAIAILIIKPQLGAAALLPAVGLLLFSQAVGAWIRRKNAASLQATGGMSAEISESLNNFKVIVAFNRRDYFRRKFAEANEANYRASLRAGIANNVFIPIYGLSSDIAMLIVLVYGIYLITVGQFTIGLLISFLSYVTRFYDPLRQIATIWASFQVALAGWDRISAILSLESDMLPVPGSEAKKNDALLTFENVHFRYSDGKEVLKGIDFTLERGKTYALVGPTGGGKTTTASLMARLYDPTEGMVLLSGKDIRSFSDADRTKKIGFILQEPFLFTGTVRDNILYGNEQYEKLTNKELLDVLVKANLDRLLERFENGLETKIMSSGDSISLGQKQLIVFIRAVLRRPDLLILDEATANIDTVTEQLLEDILKKLPKETTKVIIAHRLNTIENADEIFFVNAGTIVRAGSMEHAVKMLLEGKRES